MKSNAPVVIQRFMGLVGAETRAELAQTLGVVPSAINQAIRHNRIPELWYYKIAYRTQESLGYLETGKRGERQDLPYYLKGISAIPPDDVKFLFIRSELAEKDKVVLDLCGDLLRRGSPKLRVLIGSLLMAMQHYVSDLSESRRLGKGVNEP